MGERYVLAHQAVQDRGLGGGEVADPDGRPFLAREAAGEVDVGGTGQRGQEEGATN